MLHVVAVVHNIVQALLDQARIFVKPDLGPNC